MSVLWSTGNNDWATPPETFAALDAEFHFRLDAAASVTTTKVADNWYGPDHAEPERRDGLACDWAPGPVWCNPPYGKDIVRWVAKADQSGLTVVCLVPARVDTAWFHDHCHRHEVRWLRGRLRFNGYAKSAPFPSCVVVMRPVTDSRYCEHCGQRWTPKHRNAKYCAPKCRQAAFKKRAKETGPLTLTLDVTTAAPRKEAAHQVGSR